MWGGANTLAQALWQVRSTPSADVPRIVEKLRVYTISDVMPNTAGVAHVILAVTDNGVPALTSYRRVILTIQNAGR